MRWLGATLLETQARDEGLRIKAHTQTHSHIQRLLVTISLVRHWQSPLLGKGPPVSPPHWGWGPEPIR